MRVHPSSLRDLLHSEAALLPDVEQSLLRVQFHLMLNPRSNRAISHLLDHLNSVEFMYPGSNMRIF
jgi:hypothetical protein